jgi:GntR family transcriptional regulator/MocR family aminotransferase
VPQPRENEKSHLREPVHIPQIALERGAARPLHRQIRDQIAKAIRSGAIRPGARLPSSRVLASFLGVSRNTVLAAYDELAAADLVAGRAGSGVQVTGAFVPRFNMEALARAAHFTGRQVLIEDPDGNPIAVNY